MTFNRRISVYLIILIGGIVLLATKIYQYAAAPVRPKKCDLTYPEYIDTTHIEWLPVDMTESDIELTQKGGYINDASCMNKTPVYGVVDVTSEADVARALLFARVHQLPVTSAGQQHSMGGQSFVRNGLVLNMKGLRHMELNTETHTLHVGSGAIWADVQQYLDAKGYAVQAMQSINIFTVGGTLSVNAHGIAHDPGPIASTVRSMRIMQADGTIVTASRTEHAELFSHVLGGYGLFGVILEAELEVVPNEMYAWERTFLDYTEVPAYYEEHIKGNDDIGLFYGRISVSPSSYLRETILHTYHRLDTPVPQEPLEFSEHTWLNRLIINTSKTGPVGRFIRWTLEKYVEPSVHICSRNEAMSNKEVCLVSRNQEMYDAMGYLKNRLHDTDILQEYFIAPEHMPAFIDRLRTIVQTNNANLLNITIRFVHKDTDTALPYATEDMFAFVLYFNQKFSKQDIAHLEQTTIDLIDAATELGGTYYLPYQLYYSDQQLRAAYPGIDEFFEKKRVYDPDRLFTNTMFEVYGPSMEQ